MKVERVLDDRSLAALEPEWSALALAQGGGLPFHCWDWYVAWWKAFPARTIGVSDSPHLLTFRSDSGELVGIAPLMLTRRPGRGPLAVRVLDFFGTDPNITEIRGPLLHPAWEEECFEALQQHLRASSGDWDWIRWRGVPAGGRIEPLLQSSPGVSFTQSVMAYTLPLPGSWEGLRSSRSRNLKESLRKCGNSLRRDGLEAKFEVASTPEDVAASLGTFLELHELRAACTDTIRHPNVFASPTSRAFLCDVMARFASRGMARLFRLRIRDRTVAIRIGFAIGDTLYLYYSGFDPEWGRYSVMTTTVAGAIRHAISEGLRTVHFSTGTDVSKTRWGPTETTLREATQISPSARGRVVGRLLREFQSDREKTWLRRLSERMAGRRA